MISKKQTNYIVKKVLEQMGSCEHSGMIDCPRRFGKWIRKAIKDSEFLFADRPIRIVQKYDVQNK